VASDAGAVLSWAGHLGQAEELLLGVLESGPPPERADIAGVRLVQTLVLAGRFGEARERAAALLSRDDLPLYLRARLAAADAAALAGSGPPVAAAAAARAAMVECQAAGEEAEVVGCLDSLSRAELRRGRLARAAEAANRAVRSADAADGEARRRHPRLALALVSLARDRLDEAERALVAVGVEADEYGSAWSLPHLNVLRAALALALGRLDGAATEASAGLALARETGMRHVAAHALGLVVQARLRLDALGPVDRARRMVRDVQADVDATSPHLRWSLALLADAEGDAAGALRLLSGGLPDDLLAMDASAAPWAVRIAKRAGDANAAAGLARAIGELASHSGRVPTIAGCAVHAAALLDADREGLERAVEALRASPRPLALARALEDLGEARRASGLDVEAIDALEEALTLYGRAWAARDVARVRRDLRRLGVRRRHRVAGQDAAGGWESLSRTELAVARLVASGLTNRQAADRLFVSASTVNTHLQHIFAKLGINSRVQLARLALTRPL
jgi:ATP/maltotriose-dependent transcriptional regulator MalT